MVMVDPADRRELIVKQVQELAETVRGRSRQLNGELLSEVVNITEWPRAVLGAYAEE